MFSSIRQKLTAIYILLIIIPLLIINYLSVENIKESILGKIEVNTLKTANIISNVSRDNLKKPLLLRQSIKQYVPMLEGRILVLNHHGQVMVDSFYLLERKTIINEEIRYAFQGQEKFGYYDIGKHVLQVAVPIMQVTETEREIFGAVLVSVSVDEAFEEIESFSQQLLMISIAVFIIGILAAMLASQKISAPIVSLSLTAKRIGEGHLGEVVNIKSRDEIGRLAENFNYMSQELHRIDQGRMQFIGDVSHELKTPLASMKALIDSLLYGEDDVEVYREYLKDMDEEIDRLSEMVKSLLSLTKIEEQGITEDIYSIKHIIEEAIRILHPLAEKYEVDITMDLEDPPLVFCDGVRIKEVFINLIDNALKYRDEEKEENKVAIKGKYSRNYYHISIEDNGIGIEEDETQAIFEKFYRTDTSRSRDTGGAGLGLSIVSRILQLHKWEIAASSKVKEGTTIEICIPKSSLKVSL